jgi:hypothetical protein
MLAFLVLPLTCLDFGVGESKHDGLVLGLLFLGCRFLNDFERLRSRLFGRIGGGLFSNSLRGWRFNSRI